MSKKNNDFSILNITLGQSIISIRVLSGMFVISSVTLQYLYYNFLPTFNDPIVVRWLLNGVVALFFISTFFVKYRSANQLDLISLVLYSFVLIYTLYLTTINEFHWSAVALVIFVMAGGTVIIATMYFYVFQSMMVIIILASYAITIPITDAVVIGLFNIIVAIAVCGTILFVRLRMINMVRFSNSVLENVHLFSIVANSTGEIIFVSSSVKSLLGYSSKDLLNDGWWKNENVASSWISRDYIIIYPGVVQRDVKKFESSAITNDGRVVWLSWTTSILPDGKYMGIAYDITGFRKNV